jgi:hypothetical protein
MGNRNAAEAFILSNVEKLAPGGDTAQIYRDRFAQMDDQEFDTFMEDLGSGKQCLALIVPNKGKSSISIERNFAIAEELGHDFFQRIWMAPGKDIPTYLTNKKYMVLRLPLRRQAQLLEKKIRIPNNNRSIDDLTGQPTGASKGSKISYPELQIIASLNLPQSSTEMLKFRGGDTKGFDAMNDAIDKHGAVSLDAIEHLSGTVESTRTFSIFLNCMHLKNTLLN